MVFQHPYTQIILDKYPELQHSKEWLEDLPLYVGESKPVNISVTLTIFCRFIARTVLRTKKPSYDTKELFDFIEDMIIIKDQKLQDAVATCFLENFLNYSSEDELDSHYVDPATFVPFLGEESKDYCKGWDEFTKVRTPGLWGDDEWNEMIEKHNKKRIF